MKRVLSILSVAVFLCLSASNAFAQESQDVQDQHEKQDIVQFDDFPMNMAGDQFIRLSLAGNFPLSFGHPFTDGKLRTGGMFSLGYHYFVMKDLAVGLDAGFGFHVTIGSNLFHYIPILASVTYQPCFGKFELPLSVGIGFAWETYAGNTYWPGLVIKPEAGLHYRITNSWSVGMEAAYMFMPQFAKLYGTGEKNIMGQFLSVQLVARFYF